MARVICWTDLEEFENVRGVLDSEEVPSRSLVTLAAIYRRYGGAWEQMSTLLWLKIMMRRERIERLLTVQGRRLTPSPKNALTRLHYYPPWKEMFVTRLEKQLEECSFSYDAHDQTVSPLLKMEYEKIMWPLFPCLDDIRMMLWARRRTA